VDREIVQRFGRPAPLSSRRERQVSNTSRTSTQSSSVIFVGKAFLPPQTNIIRGAPAKTILAKLNRLLVSSV